jgi:transposase
MYEFIIGCDMSKDSLDAAYYQNDKSYYVDNFSNDKKGFITLIKEMKKITKTPSSRWLIVFENTGVYSKLFKYWLIRNNINCVEDNPTKISGFDPMKRAKTDPEDAKMIAEYGFEKQKKTEA